MALIGKAVAEAPAVAADRIGVEGSRDFILYQRQVIAHAVADGRIRKMAERNTVKKQGDECVKTKMTAPKSYR